MVVMERTNIRYVTPEDLGEALDLSVVDVSFISLKIVLPAIQKLLKPTGQVLCLIKPQFEAGKELVGKKGVVRDPAVHEQVVQNFVDLAAELGFTLRNLTFSPVKGPEGNIEFLGHLAMQPGGAVSPDVPVHVDRDFELPRGLIFTDIRSEIRGADMLICFGGDGTILHTSKIATQHNIPVLGVNIGTMGFIAELESGELELLRKIPKKEFTIENRSMLDISVSSGGQQTFHEIALNDAVVTKGAIARVIQISICCDGVEATNYSGDGVIVCTPTGSTAYSMSAGGPIMEPSARNLLMTPICAHAMLAKSIVLGTRRVVTIRVSKIGRHNAFLSVDGGRAYRMNPNDVITVKSSEKTTRLVRLKSMSFFELLNRKFIDRQRY